MLRGYWYLLVINEDIFLLRLFDFHVAETCSPMLTGFFVFNVHDYRTVRLRNYGQKKRPNYRTPWTVMYMASSLSWLQWLLCAIEYFAQCINIVLIEPSHLRGQ